MVAFTMFSIPPPSSASDLGYGCVISSGRSSWWTHNCPSDLEQRIQDAHAKGEMVFDVSVASNGDWFLSTSAFNTGKLFDDVSKSRVTKFCELATHCGVKTTVGNISWISFMPGAEGYIGVTTVDGVEHCFYDGIPQSLKTHLSASKSQTVRSASVGHADSWIVLYRDGCINWSGVPEALTNKLKAGASSDVESIILSPISSDQFIINYESGASCYVLPSAWKPALARHEALLSLELSARLEQAAANASYMAAMNAASINSAIATMSAGNF